MHRTYLGIRERENWAVVHHAITFYAGNLAGAGAGDVTAGHNGEGDDESRANLRRALELRGGGAGCKVLCSRRRTSP
jgi:hypothetical protein